MSINEKEVKFEGERLELVRREIKSQLNEKQNLKQQFVKNSIEEQKNLWEDVGAISPSGGMNDIVTFMSYIDELKRVKRVHELSRTQVERLEKMMGAPYFGRVDFIEQGEEEEEKIYIGMGGLINETNDLLIYDWRAPISSMYYDYELGKVQYTCPQGVVKGELTLKRQYKIVDGKIQYMFDSNLKIDDDILQEILSNSADNKMKTIVTTIQKEQNKAIRDEENKVLVVQGPAGSGKTSIALHRIAYLLYKHRNKITSNNILIFSPNEIFNDYISEVLPDLGEDNIYQTTYTGYMHKALNLSLMKEDTSTMMEYILNCKRNKEFEARIDGIKFKGSMDFINILRNYAQLLEEKEPNFIDIVYKNKVIVDTAELKQLFYHDYKLFPLKKRLSKIRERILFLLKPIEKENIKKLTEELYDTGEYMDLAEVKEKSIATVREENRVLKQSIFNMTEFNLLDIYKDLFMDIERMKLLNNGRELPKSILDIKKNTLKSLNNGMLKYEDQPPILYLKILLGDIQDTSTIKYIVIDEAQDYTPLQYDILKQLFPKANITILGDLSQSINFYMNVGNYENIAKIFSENNTNIINLTKSYRSTAEITSFCRNILEGEVKGEWVQRSGEKPKIIKVKKSELYHRILEDVEILKSQGYKSIGVIGRNNNQCYEVYRYLKDRTEIKLINKDDDEYSKGVVVIPSYLSKGLEFDGVIVVDAGGENYVNRDEQNLLYTVCTRALHQLHVYYIEENSIIGIL